MTERGLPSTDGAPACPFVAFGDDRDGRSTSPDHRHRCFAESPPAPRAVAHQEAYCLSSAFPVCPTFQDWARREAAHTRGVGERPETAPTAVPSPGPIDGVDDIADDEPPRPLADDPPVHRNPPRDWAAPPPWATGGAGPGRTTPSGAEDAAADCWRSEPSRARAWRGAPPIGWPAAPSPRWRRRGPPRAPEPRRARPTMTWPAWSRDDPRRRRHVPTAIRRRAGPRCASRCPPARAATRSQAPPGKGCAATRPTRTIKARAGLPGLPAVRIAAARRARRGDRDRRARVVHAARAAGRRWAVRRIERAEPIGRASSLRRSPTVEAGTDPADLHRQAGRHACRRSPRSSA